MVKYPGSNKLVPSPLPPHLVLHLLYDAPIDLQHISVGERGSAIWPKECPVPKVNTGAQEGAEGAKSHLNTKLILASAYEIPSLIEDNKNSLTSDLKIGENLMISYPPTPPSIAAHNKR